LNREQLL